MISEIREINSCNSWIENVLERIGGLEEAWLIGDFAKGKDSKIIDVIIIGYNLNQEALLSYVAKAEELSGRKIRILTINCDEKEAMLSQFPEKLLIYGKEALGTQYV